MTDITIPPEAVEAAARALCKDARLFWPDLTKAEHDIMRGEARAACLAMLKAWPGMGTIIIGINEGSIILPQEKTDDKA